MIPSFSKFKANVQDDKGKLGPNVQLVVDALEYYWDRHDDRTVEDELVVLKDLYEECRKWIKLKEGKSEFKKGLFGKETNYYNERYVNRKLHIASLAEETLKTLLQMLEESGLLTSQQRGELTFNIRKFREKGKKKILRHQNIGLSKGYGLERESWIKSGKTVAISGSTVHETVKFMQDAPESKEQGKAIQKMLSGQEDLKLWKILSGVENSTRGRGSVIYLKKRERYRFMLFVQNGKLKDYEGNDKSTFINEGRTQNIYAMDSYGSLFAYDEVTFLQDTGRQDLGAAMINHSSVNSGREVICAGLIRIEGGKLKKINNSSGHYKPSKQQLYECLAILQGEGLDMSECEVGVVAGPGVVRTDWVKWQFHTAASFMDSRGSAEPHEEVEAPA